jgi:hypothetical protein
LRDKEINLVRTIRRGNASPCYVRPSIRWKVVLQVVLNRNEKLVVRHD